MGRRIAIVVTLVSASCLAASSSGCCGGCCGGCGLAMNGYADGPGATCPNGCDRYAARPYHHQPCCLSRHDPRIPGPKVMSTLPPEPEAPGYFHPVPTYPVFGPRSEEADGIEPELQPLAPDNGPVIDHEALPPPRMGRIRGQSDEEISDDPASELKLAAPQQAVKHAGWKAVKKHTASDRARARPSAKRTVTFRESPTKSR